MLPEGPDLVPPGRPRDGGPEDGEQPRQLRRPLRQPGLVQQPALQVSRLSRVSLYHRIMGSRVVPAVFCFVSLEITM